MSVPLIATRSICPFVFPLSSPAAIGLDGLRCPSAMRSTHIGSAAGKHVGHKSPVEKHDGSISSMNELARPHVRLWLANCRNFARLAPAGRASRHSLAGAAHLA